VFRLKDVLSDVLDTVDLKAALYFRTEYYPPFGVQVPAYKRAARFHLVMQGRCSVSLDQGRGVELAAGDLVLIPNGGAHKLSDHPEREARALDQVLVESGFRGDGPFRIGSGEPDQACQMVCGHFTFREGADHPFLCATPEILFVPATARLKRPILDDVLRLVARGMLEEAPGAVASVSRLSEVLFIELMRAGLDQGLELRKMMSALADPQVGRALSLIHERPADPWTVESLAAAVGMSRSRFAERFRELLASSPMTYLADWRFQRALKQLNQSRAPIKAVARDNGYASSAAFTRAFRRRFGCAPKEAKAAAQT
jgi:AraC-like DNA-binding protein